MGFFELHRNIQIRIVVDFLQKIINNMITPFMALYLVEQFDKIVAGGLIAFAIIIGSASSFFVGYYADTHGRRRVFLILEGSSFIIFLIMALANSEALFSPWLTYMMYLCHSIVVYSTSPVSDAMFVDVSTPETRKTIYSISYWT
ncbi:MAG: MFS transporter, partial [Bacilli bacterium]